MKCIQCNKEFELSEKEIRFFEAKGLSLPKRCKGCREEKKTVYMWIVCTTCGKAFPFYESERRYYLQKGYKPPKYCKGCRVLKGIPLPGMKKNTYQNGVELYGPNINVSGGLLDSPGYSLSKMKQGEMEFSSDYLGKKRKFHHKTDG